MRISVNIGQKRQDKQEHQNRVRAKGYWLDCFYAVLAQMIDEDTRASMISDRVGIAAVAADLALEQIEQRWAGVVEDND